MFLEGVRQSGQNQLTIVDLWTRDVIGQVADDGPAEVHRAVTSVANSRWVLPPAARAEILTKAADAVAAQADRFSALITSESGVCVRETVREVTRAVTNLRIAAVEAERLRGETLLLPSGDRIAMTLLEPVGVVAGITPFNRPLNQVVVKAAPAIAAGCAFVLKPSEKTPLTALAFAEILINAGYPAEMLAVLTGDPARVGGALACHPDVDMVTFTGGVVSGRAVAAAAAGKKQLLELGGNDPLIVLADADLKLAARLAADGAYATAGQSCRGVKRIIVDQQVADDFVELLIEATSHKRYGDPRDPQTDVGPLITEAAAIEVERRIDTAIAAGAKKMYGDARVGGLVPPTVLDHVPAKAELVTQETFGPVAPVLRVSGVDEAIAVANSTAYGLQAGVVTADNDAFWRIAAGLRVGSVNLAEGPQFDSPHIPFGGVKSSGVGREGIPYAIREMTSVKTITVPSGRPS